MNIVLIYPPYEATSQEPRFLRKKFAVSQPLGLGYVAAALEKNRYQVNVIDAKVESLTVDQVVNRVRDIRPGIVGLSVSTSDVPVVVRIAQKLKQAGNYVIVIGGPHVSALPEETMRDDHFDYGVIGEGEKTMVELAEAISSGNIRKIADIPGLIFRNGSDLVRTQARAYIEDLDTLPFPARHLFPPLRRYPSFLYYKYFPTAPVITSRGCPYQCTFCDRAVFANVLRMRSAESIIDEIEQLVREQGVRGIDIMDDLFTLDPERVLAFCRKLLERNLTIGWSCFARVDTVNREMLTVMKKAGCWMIGYGIESGNQAVLSRMKKNITLASIVEAVTETHRAGIRVFGNFILGLPGEDEHTLGDTLALAGKLPLYRAIFHIAQPFPGSDLYKEAMASERLREDVEYGDYYYHDVPEKCAYLTADLSFPVLKKYLRKAYRDFYLRPAYLIRRIFVYREFHGFGQRVRLFWKDIW